MKCKTCGETIKSNCDWRQGRCPHRSPMFNEIVSNKFKMRFYNLLKAISNLFNTGNK